MIIIKKLKRLFIDNDYISQIHRDVCALDETQNLFDNNIRPYRGILIENPIQLYPFIHSLLTVFIFPFTHMGIMSILFAQLIVSMAYGYLYSILGCVGLGWSSKIIGTIAVLGAAFGGIIRVLYAHIFTNDIEDNFTMIGVWWILSIIGAGVAFAAGTTCVAMAINKGYSLDNLESPNLSSVDIIGECWLIIDDIWNAPEKPSRKS